MDYQKSPSIAIDIKCYHCDTVIERYFNGYEKDIYQCDDCDRIACDNCNSKFMNIGNLGDRCIYCYPR